MRTEQINPEEILRELLKLPYEGRLQVYDFIAFLKQRYQRLNQKKDLENSKLSDESFIGIWQVRTDLQDSTSWVRSLRQREWGDDHV